MNLKSLSMLTVCAIAVAAPAQAATFSLNAHNVATPNCLGQTTCTVNNFFTLTATGGKIDKKVNPMIGIGVNDGNPNHISGEIEVGEALDINFAKKGVLTSLHLNLLYPKDVHDNGNPMKQAYGDRIFEVAIVSDTDQLHEGTLKITDDHTAVWSFVGGGQVINHAQSVTGKGGWYEIINPFGGAKIRGITLKPHDNPQVGGKGDSDFAFYAATVAVPEPTTLIGLGAIGLAIAGRRRATRAD
jgi:hypothetical protein